MGPHHQLCPALGTPANRGNPPAWIREQRAYAGHREEGGPSHPKSQGSQLRFWGRQAGTELTRWALLTAPPPCPSQPPPPPALSSLGCRDGGPRPQSSDSVGLGWAPDSAFLTSSQVRHEKPSSPQRSPRTSITRQLVRQAELWLHPGPAESGPAF